MAPSPTNASRKEDDKENNSVNYEMYNKFINAKTMTLVVMTFFIVGVILSIIYIAALKYKYNANKKKMSQMSMERQPVILVTSP